MTDETSQPARPNRTLLFFLIAGPLLFVAGLIGTFAAKGIAEQAATLNADGAGYAAVLEGRSLADASLAESLVTPDYTFMWVWIVVGSIGIILLIVGLAVKASHAR